MGMYTEIFFKGEIPKEQADIIQELASYDHGVRIGVDHPFFLTERAGSIFSGVSAYFSGGNKLTISRVFGDSYSSSGKEWRDVSFRANVKNYGNEIEKFFDWIEPYVRDNGFYGYSQYEEDRVPTLYVKGARGDGAR